MAQDMIRIIYENNDDSEIAEYRVHFRDLHICNFQHNRYKGLADCLQKAAEAVELTEWADKAMLHDIKGG